MNDYSTIEEINNSHKKGDGPGYAAFTGTAGPASSLTVSTIPWTHIKINGSQGNLKKRNKFVTDGARFCCYCILFTKDSQSVHSFLVGFISCVPMRMVSRVQ